MVLHDLIANLVDCQGAEWGALGEGFPTTGFPAMAARNAFQAHTATVLICAPRPGGSPNTGLFFVLCLSLGDGEARSETKVKKKVIPFLASSPTAQRVLPCQLPLTL